MNHTQLLNALIERYGYTSYLEIGVQDRKQNLDKINLPVHAKHGVDPDKNSGADYVGTSDEFFKEMGELVKFDLIFIDGLHHAEQVRKDFENSLRILNLGGRIVIHDCLPSEERTTHVPRDSKVWHGDVYKFVMTLAVYNGVNIVTYDFDEGCCVVSKGKELEHLSTLAVMSQMKWPTKHEDVTWEWYLEGKQSMMNIQPWQ